MGNALIIFATIILICIFFAARGYGSLPGCPFASVPEQELRYYISIYYATNSLIDQQGRQILLARVSGNANQIGWRNSFMSLPRILTILPEGWRSPMPVPELANLRNDHFLISDISLANTSYLVGNVERNAPEIIVELELENARIFGVKLYSSDNAGLT